MTESNEELRIPVVAESIEAGAEKTISGRVRVHKTVQAHDEIIDQILHREDVEVRRVVKNQVVEGPLPVRNSGDTIIVPVVKEVLKIEKQWVLTEELHLTKHASRERSEQRVTLLEEHADVERLDAQGNLVRAPTPAPEVAERAAPVSSEPFTERLRSRSRAPKAQRPKFME